MTARTERDEEGKKTEIQHVKERNGGNEIPVTISP
jgi:hypothetical protein